MDLSRSRKHRILPASISVIVLLLGSVALASSASADPSPKGTSHSADGQARASSPDAQGDGHEASGSNGSAVSLTRPNQFQAQADPDGMLNGGVDQRGGQGGVDTTDQDGNNGSGNDADCEDDNRGVGVPGHCKDRTPDAPATGTEDISNATVADAELTGSTTDTTTTDNTDTTDTTDTTDSVESAGGAVPAASADSGLLPPVLVAAPGPATHVAAPRTPTSAGAPGPVDSILPSTGAGQALLALLVTGLAALAVGGGLVVPRRRRTA